MSTTVLVVEDDQEINELLGEYLALENFRYVAATTGNAGLTKAAGEHPDAVVLDLMLPDIDGFEVARKLTTHRETFDIPVIILSCMNQTCDREKGFGSGALYYMCKPFLPDDLLATLRLALEWKRGLKNRPPTGALTLGGVDLCELGRGLHEMAVDLFSHTDLTDEAVEDVRRGVAMLASWVDRWDKEHASKCQIRLGYQLGGAGGGTVNGAGRGQVEWTMTELSGPGLINEVFFKPATAATGGGFLGWNVVPFRNKAAVVTPVELAPSLPQPWLELLPKLGATRYLRDAATKTVKILGGKVDGETTGGAASAAAKVESTK